MSCSNCSGRTCSICNNVINELKKKVVQYPNELGEAMIKHYLDMGNRWNNREALLAREDWLMLHQVIVSVHSKCDGRVVWIKSAVCSPSCF